MNSNNIKVLLISGSLRKNSTNTGLLRAAVQIGHKNLTFEWADISDFPIFNEDIEQKGVPQAVQRVKEQVKNSQAFLFGVTQNNHSVSAALKNAYDWLSRGKFIQDYPAGMLSSGGDKGGLRGQDALRVVGEYLNIKFLNGHDIAVKRFSGKFFDEQGNLIDENTRNQIRDYLSHFALWIEKSREVAKV